ncbi:MAG TPA: hypothetical protein VE397_13000 [Stellaceae bacterium]|jgi:hypothetical protein|nr:hypothetical protein [Stellaceae bacterium]
MAIVAVLAVSTAAAHAAYTYKSARKLYDDCAAPAKLKNGAPTVKREQCTAYLNQVLSAWNLNQDNGVCSAHTGGQLPDAYVHYWQKRGLGVLKGEFRSAEASVNDFLDSQRQHCPDRPQEGDPDQQ